MGHVLPRKALQARAWTKIVSLVAPNREAEEAEAAEAAEWEEERAFGRQHDGASGVGTALEAVMPRRAPVSGEWRLAQEGSLRVQVLRSTRESVAPTCSLLAGERRR